MPLKYLRDFLKEMENSGVGKLHNVFKAVKGFGPLTKMWVGDGNKLTGSYQEECRAAVFIDLVQCYLDWSRMQSYLIMCWYSKLNTKQIRDYRLREQ